MSDPSETQRKFLSSRKEERVTGRSRITTTESKLNSDGKAHRKILTNTQSLGTEKHFCLPAGKNESVRKRKLSSSTENRTAAATCVNATDTTVPFEERPHPVWKCRREGCDGNLTLLGRVQDVKITLEESRKRAALRRLEFPHTYFHGSVMSCSKCGDRPKAQHRRKMWQKLCIICNRPFAMNGFWRSHGGVNLNGYHHDVQNRVESHKKLMRRWLLESNYLPQLSFFMTSKQNPMQERKWFTLALEGKIDPLTTPLTQAVLDGFRSAPSHNFPSQQQRLMSNMHSSFPRGNISSYPWPHSNGMMMYPLPFPPMKLMHRPMPVVYPSSDNQPRFVETTHQPTMRILGHMMRSPGTNQYVPLSGSIVPQARSVHSVVRKENGADEGSKSLVAPPKKRHRKFEPVFRIPGDPGNHASTNSQEADARIELARNLCRLSSPSPSSSSSSSAPKSSSTN